MSQQYEYDSFDAILHYIFRQTQGDAWFKPSEENVAAGVCIRVETGHFRVFPYENPFLAPFEAAVRLLNPVVAVKVRSAAVHSALNNVAPDATAIYVDQNTRIQVLESMPHLPTADKEQCGAFIRDERVLIVWSDNLDNITDLCREFEEKLIKLVWRSRPGTMSTAGSIMAPSWRGSDAQLNEKQPLPLFDSTVKDKPPAPKKKSFWSWSWRLSPPTPDTDSEKASGKATRPIRLFAPVYIGLALALSVCFIAGGVNVLIGEYKLDKNYLRFLLLVTTPFQVCVSFFFAQSIISNLVLIVGPIAQYHENSRYYSAIKPKPNPEIDLALPHITVELPVYKESLEHVIGPSVFSLKKAMQTYARQGGTSAIFVHDDGLQSLGAADREERIAFYANHNIGWVARPPHSNAPDGFHRAGRFKKASNLNYGLALSLKLEKHLAALEAAGAEDGDEDYLEDRALDLAIEETFKESGGRWRPWASNGKSLRMGEIILMVDSDTIVPEDCFRDAARELTECPEVAILQHESDVMQVAHDYFENGITHFTRRINKSISMGCANGEIAPFVGHNAFLRWSALQDAAFIDKADDRVKIWSETNVSEDFDMSLRLQLRGYITRWATYSKGGFKEGVSLTIEDELNRWQKYAYGCSEMIFNPFVTWWRLGPINRGLHNFVWSKSPVHYKIGVLSYIFSYYALAGSAMLTLLNYVILGFGLDIDACYLPSFEIWLNCIAVFTVAGNVGFIVLEYRLGHRGIFSSFMETILWIPFFFFFFGGLSIHLSTALLAHMFSYNIIWGATKKEVEQSNFFKEVPKILKRFWLAFLLSFSAVAAMVILATDLVPLEWQIPAKEWALIFPLAMVAGCHILFPIVLNPWLMIFSY